MCMIPTTGIHPMSLKFLEIFYDGYMPAWEFVRWFGMADSRLIDLGICLAKILS